MSERRKKTFYVMVAFRYDQKRSVMYLSIPNEELVGKWVVEALCKYDADVISIRKVYEKCPLPEKPT